MLYSPWSSEVDKFLALLLASRLLDVRGVEEACADFVPDGIRNDLELLCYHLKAKKILTGWQCDRLNEGRYKGFFLDNYRFLDHLTTEDTTSTFLAEDISTGKRVALAITPPMIVPLIDGKPQYQVTKVFED